jgi:hypothetical protein
MSYKLSRQFNLAQSPPIDGLRSSQPADLRRALADGPARSTLILVAPVTGPSEQAGRTLAGVKPRELVRWCQLMACHRINEGDGILGLQSLDVLRKTMRFRLRGCYPLWRKCSTSFG